MKIGLVCPISWEPLRRFLPDGLVLPRPLIFNFGAELAAALMDRGHEIHVFTQCHHFSGERHVAGRGLHLHIAGYRKGAWRYTLDMYRVENASLRRMIAANPCDVFHAHWTYEFALPVVTSPVRAAVSMRDNPIKVLRYFHPKRYRLMRLVLAYRVLLRTRQLVVASEYMARYARRWHAYRGKIALIPNAVADYCFTPAPRRQQACGKVVFACVGDGFMGCKNVDTLLRAFGRLRRDGGASCELRLYGWPHSPHDQTERWAAARGLADGVVFCGKRPHHEMIEDVRQHADVLVHPSREESFGNVIAEAMAIGIPTIVGKASGAAPWVAGNGEAGLLVDIGRSDALVEGMRRMAADAGLRQRLGERAHALANEHYRLERVVQQHIALYESMIAANQ